MANMAPESRSQRVSNKYNIRAIPLRNGLFRAEFTVPGKSPELLRDEDGSLSEYETELEALADAGEELCASQNERTRDKNGKHFVHMGGAELARSLAALNISPSEMSWLCGTRQETVIDWINGTKDVPHYARVMLALLAFPGAMALARQITEATKVREPT